MENKKITAFKFVLAVFLLLNSTFVFAKKSNKKSNAQKNNVVVSAVTAETQENDEQNGEQATEESAEEKWQLLEWEEDEPDFVLKYEVVIEEYSEKTKTYSEKSRVLTQDNTPSVRVEPLLPPGRYRYKVISYNLIDVPEAESDWFDFMIYKAYQPEVSDVKSEVNLTSTLFLEEINDGIFNISGKNFFELPQNEGEITFSEYFLVNQKKKNVLPLIPNILSKEKNRKMQVQFDMKTLDVGKYNFVVRDASGLESEKDRKNEVEVKFRKRVDFDLSGGYVFPIVLFDDTFKTYFDTSVFPLSLTARASFIPFKHRFGYFGFGLYAQYSRLFAEYQYYMIDGNFMNADALFIYQLPIRVKFKNAEKPRHILTLELHGGTGVSFLNDVKFHFDHDITSDPLNSLNLNIMAGGAFQFYVTNRLYTEVSVDFISSLLSDMALGVLLPAVSIGWQF